MGGFSNCDGDLGEVGENLIVDTEVEQPEVCVSDQNNDVELDRVLEERKGGTQFDDQKV